MAGSSHHDTPDPFRDAWYLTGPTAAGKTAVGIALAHRIGAEIIALDSMTVYRDMDIGTAKPTPAQQADVRHHLLDLIPPTAEFSISQYLAAATEAVEEIRSRGKIPLFVGGTPLYLRALLRGIEQGPPPDPAFRAEVMREVERVGPASLHQRLELVDPLAAARIHPNDVKRMIRALEVFHASGKPISHSQRHFDEPPAELPRFVFALQWPRPALHQRINERVTQMFERGLIDEVQRLLEQYGRLGKTAAQAVGYQETLAHLQSGRPYDETVAAVQARTRRFARRQETWFRSFEEIQPIAAADQAPESLADQIVELARRA